MTTYNQHDNDVIKTFCQFEKIFTNSIYLPSFIVIWLEIAKLEGGGGGGGAKWVQIRLKIFAVFYRNLS